MNLREKALKGLKLDDILVIDADAHYIEEWLTGYDKYMETMDRIGIDKIACSMIDLEFADLYPDRVLAKRPYDGYSDEVDDLKRWMDKPGTIGFGEINPNGHGQPCTGKFFDKMWEVADSKKAMVLMHTWYPNPYCDPDMLVEIADRYPNVLITLIHSGGSVEGMIKSARLVKKYENIYMELNNTGHHYGEIEYLAKHTDINKVFYGSDWSSEDFASHFGPILFARVSEKIKEKILGLNFKHAMERMGRYR